MRDLSAICVAAAFLACSGCASVSVDRVVRNENVRPVEPPRGIFVAPFSAPNDTFSLGGRGPADFVETRNRIVAELQKRIVAETGRYAGPAYALYSPDRIPPGAWVIAGKFVRVDQGSRAMRAGIGFGAGESSVQTSVTLYAFAGGQLVPLLAFDTKGGSGKMPGVAPGVALGFTGVGAASLATSTALGLLPGVTDDLDRTAYEVAAVLSHYLAQHGLLDPARQAIQPKRPGKIPARVNPDRAIPAPLRPS